MKKIVSFIMVLVLLFGVCATVGAAQEDTTLKQKFYDYCVNVMPEDMKPEDLKDISIDETQEIEGVELFFGWCNKQEPESVSVYKAIGNWRFYSDKTYYPYDLGLFVCSGDEIYNLEDAYEIGLITDLAPIKYFTYRCSVVNSKESDRYIDELLPVLMKRAVGDYVTYSEVYEYYAPSNPASGDEATPDYVLVNFETNAESPMPIADVFGDYVLWAYGGNHPFDYGYCVYLPESKEYIDLVNALKMNLAGIENAFVEGGIGNLIGDMDKERKITVRDATYIQKCIAGLEKFERYDKIEHFDAMLNNMDETPPLLYISDFNRDCQRNIKDATAIQKSIAGLEY